MPEDKKSKILQTEGTAAPIRLIKVSRRAKILAFVSICIAGLCGGLIGYAYTDIQCDGDCGISAALFGLLGALIASIGVAVISVLVLRTMEEHNRGGKKLS